MADATTTPALAERRRVLVLARQFPPIGGAGAQRSVGTVRYLRDFGYEPIVVTGPAQHVDRFNPHDRSMLGRIPADIEVHRVVGPEPAGRTGWRARADRWLQRPAPWTTWWVERAVELGLRVGQGAELVFASCNPYETALAGGRLSEALGVPWVADLEDPWALDEMRVHPSWLHHRRDLARMRGALDSAAALIMCAGEAAERMRAALPPRPGRAVVNVPIGFDRDDLPEPVRLREDDGVLRIVHTGTVHTELGLSHRRTRRLRRLLGGNATDVDILTRSPVFLLQALDALLAAEPAWRGRFELHLVGPLTAGDQAALGGRDYVRAIGRLDHVDTLAAMRRADLLFLPMHELPPGQRAGIVPYKTYEYLAAERPILAAVPAGDARDLLAGLEHVTVCGPSDVDGLRRAVRAALDAPRPAVVRDGVTSPALRDLERRHAVEQIAATLDGVLVFREPVSGA